MKVAKGPLYQPVEIFKDLDDDERGLLSFLLTQGIPGEDPVQIMNLYVESINRCLRQERRENLLKEINKVEKTGNNWLYNGLLHELMILKRIDEAERDGDQGRIDQLLQEYRQLESNNWKYPREGIDGK